MTAQVEVDWRELSDRLNEIDRRAPWVLTLEWIAERKCMTEEYLADFHKGYSPNRAPAVSIQATKLMALLDAARAHLEHDKLARPIHQTVPVQVWADVDVGIADLVKYLNTIPGVRTHASCQGTIGEGGPEPYGPQVMVSWDRESSRVKLESEFDVRITHPNSNSGYVEPRPGWTAPAPQEREPFINSQVMGQSAGEFAYVARRALTEKA